MGFLGNNEDNETSSRKGQVEEVSINVPDEENNKDNSSLRNEAEKKFNRSSSSSKSISLEDVHRQNEKIISMLEELQDEEKNNSHNDTTNVGGAMDGVL